MSEIQNRDQKVQQNSDRAARIREFRAETIARRPLPPKVKKQPPDLTAGEFNRREC